VLENEAAMAKVKLKSSQERLRDIGKAVARRLSAPSRCQQAHGKGATLYLAQDFLKIDECAALIEHINQGREPSTLLAEHPDADFRTSDSCHLNKRQDLVEEIENRICALMGVDRRHGETLQGQVYEVGQQFKPHYDWFRKGAAYWERMNEAGGQRSWTAMIYLNEPAAGGETHFPTAGLTVKARTGMLVLWNNMLPDGTPNEATLHAGTPVKAGTKYIVTKWFRERYWQ
jgi:prolyl 4-hydroxylase